MNEPTHLRPLPTDPADLAALKHWHKGSAILNGDGNPLVVYHGTYVRQDKQGQPLLGDIHQFDRSASTTVVRRAASFDTIGSWFSSNPGEGGAEMYGNTIYPVYLRITRPKHYDSFQEFLDAFNAANGSPAGSQGLGDAAPLREQLKSQGYDGICFARSNNAELKNDCTEMAAAVRRAKDEYWAAPKHEREIYEAKVKRLEGSLRALQAELKLTGNSIEFDKQWAMIAFEPEQIKSALGSDRIYEPDSPFLCSISPEEQALKIDQHCQRTAIQAQIEHLGSEFNRLGSMDAFINHFAGELSRLGGQDVKQERSWLENVFTNGEPPLETLGARLQEVGYELPQSSVMNALNASAPSTSFPAGAQVQPVERESRDVGAALQALNASAPPPKKPDDGREHEMEMGM